MTEVKEVLWDKFYTKELWDHLKPPKAADLLKIGILEGVEGVITKEMETLKPDERLVFKTLYWIEKHET